MYSPGLRLIFLAPIVAIRCAGASTMTAQSTTQDAAASKVVVTLVSGTGCSGGVYDARTIGGPCQFSYSLTCQSSVQVSGGVLSYQHRTVLQGPTTYNGEFVHYYGSAGPEIQLQTCTLYGLTSGRCHITSFIPETTSSTLTTVLNAWYWTLTAGDFNPVPISAANGDTALLNSVALCIGSPIPYPPTITPPSRTSNAGSEGSSTEMASAIDRGTPGLSVAEKAGIGVGVGIAFVLLLGLGALLVRRRRRKAQSRSHLPAASETGEVGVGKDGGAPLYEIGQEEKEMPTGKEAHELSSQALASELAAKPLTSMPRYELPADHIPKKE